MKYEDKLDLIQSYIQDVKEYKTHPGLSTDEKQHMQRALDTYINLYNDVERGKLDPDVLYENITSFLYMLQ